MRLIDAISGALAVIAGLMLFILIGVMIFEVVSRYAFGAPTMWSADLTYMLNGAIFMLAAAYCLRMEGHIRIDFLVEKLPRRIREALDTVLFVLVVTPPLAAISYVAVLRAWRSFSTSEVDPVSVFAPVIWPFHAVVALGLCMLTIQAVLTALRTALATVRPYG